MEDIKSIRIELPYADENGRMAAREQTVTFRKPIVQDTSAGLFQGLGKGQLIFYTMNLSLQIPEHIYNKLKGQYVSRSRDFAKEGTKYDDDIAKTLTASSLDILTKNYRDIILDYKWLIDMSKKELRKVIFYNFDGYINDSFQSKWNSSKMGKKLEVKYGYLIGYVSDDNKYYFNSEKKTISTSHDKFIIEWNKVDYTEEREQYFERLYAGFIKIIDDLKDFGNKIDNHSIDNIIAKQTKLLSL